MFLVIEIQKGEGGQLTWLVTQHSDLRDAQSKYHTVLGFAAKSGLPRHGAVILNEFGVNICNESFSGSEEE